MRVTPWLSTFKFCHTILFRINTNEDLNHGDFKNHHDLVLKTKRKSK